MASPVGAMGMGCLRVFSDSDPDPEAVEAKERNDQIDLQLEQWAEERRKDLKVVFFGEPRPLSPIWPSIELWALVSANFARDWFHVRSRWCWDIDPYEAFQASL